MKIVEYLIKILNMGRFSYESISEALIIAARCRHIHIIEFFIKNEPKRIAAALTNAAYEGYLDIIEFFINQDATLLDLSSLDENEEDEEDEEEAEDAEEKKDPEAYKYGGDILRTAISRGHLAIAQFLINKKPALVNAPEYMFGYLFEYTPLMIALERANIEILKLLIVNNVALNLHSRSGLRLLEMACRPCNLSRPYSILCLPNLGLFTNKLLDEIITFFLSEHTKLIQKKISCQANELEELNTSIENISKIIRTFTPEKHNKMQSLRIGDLKPATWGGIFFNPLKVNKQREFCDLMYDQTIRSHIDQYCKYRRKEKESLNYIF